jgi:hypothetical protein
MHIHLYMCPSGVLFALSVLSVLNVYCVLNVNYVLYVLYFLYALYALYAVYAVYCVYCVYCVCVMCVLCVFVRCGEGAVRCTNQCIHHRVMQLPVMQIRVMELRVMELPILMSQQSAYSMETRQCINVSIYPFIPHRVALVGNHPLWLGSMVGLIAQQQQ